MTCCGAPEREPQYKKRSWKRLQLASYKVICQRFLVGFKIPGGAGVWKGSIQICAKSNIWIHPL